MSGVYLNTTTNIKNLAFKVFGYFDAGLGLGGLRQLKLKV